MQIELDHVFILVEPGARVADRLVELGIKESFSRDHPGQGTSNRRFEFSNGMLEFLYVRDADEANNGPACDLRFPYRVSNPEASPFGLIFHRKSLKEDGLPFDGWRYQPDYFESPMAFHIGNNSSDLNEPLCIYVPFIEPSERVIENGRFKSINRVIVHQPSIETSDVLKNANSAVGLSIVPGDEHLLEILLDDNQQGKTKDFRPEIPLILRW